MTDESRKDDTCDWAAVAGRLRSALLFRHLTRTHSFRRALSARLLSDPTNVYRLIASMCLERQLCDAVSVGQELDLAAVRRTTQQALAAAASTRGANSPPAWESIQRDLASGMDPGTITW